MTYRTSPVSSIKDIIKKSGTGRGGICYQDAKGGIEENYNVRDQKLKSFSLRVALSNGQSSFFDVIALVVCVDVIIRWRHSDEYLRVAEILIFYMHRGGNRNYNGRIKMYSIPSPMIELYNFPYTAHTRQPSYQGQGDKTVCGRRV